MADSVVALYNMALGNIGVSQLVNDVADTTKPAVTCTTWYATARDMVLRSAPWPFATRYVLLAARDSVPTTNWAYAYGYPTDCLKALDLDSGAGRQPAVPTPFQIAGDNEGRIILSDLTPATLRYITRDADVTQFTPDVDLAIAWRLADFIAMPLAQDKNVKQNCANMAAMYLGQAISTAANEGQLDPALDSAFQRARD